MSYPETKMLFGNPVLTFISENHSHHLFIPSQPAILNFDLH